MGGWGANPAPQLARAARIVAFWCQEFGIPCRLTTTGRGITGHKSLGAAGGGHGDPNLGISLARFVGMCQAELRRGGFRPRWGVY